MITIVGGVYYESCIHPRWTEYMGSGGRAVSAIVRMNADANLITYLDSKTESIIQNKAVLENFKYTGKRINQLGKFEYMHGLSSPAIEAEQRVYEPIEIDIDKILCFGMLEGEAIIKSDYAVYDPQNHKSPKHFHENGSNTTHLALILNVHEAKVLSGDPRLEEKALIQKLIEQSSAEVIVLKQGPKGALLFYKSEFTRIPSYITEKVWKIGSGDVFTSHFAHSWLVCGRNPLDSAYIASKATACYCNKGILPDQSEIEKASFPTARISSRVQKGYKPKVYLAGPFFTLSQLWMIEQARNNLRSLDLEVFSPLHDVGRGPAEEVVHHDLEGIRECDVVFAIGDGLDPGTIYETGYAKALNKPVIFYAENETIENMKMMSGSSCIISTDYVSAIYRTAWEAISI